MPYGKGLVKWIAFNGHYINKVREKIVLLIGEILFFEQDFSIAKHKFKRLRMQSAEFNSDGVIHLPRCVKDI